MHRINVTKKNELKVKELLDSYGVSYDLYTLPEDYSVLSTNDVLRMTLIVEMEPFVVPSGTSWDDGKVLDDLSSFDRGRRDGRRWAGDYKQYGFSSAEEYLEHLERKCEEEIAEVRAKDPLFAESHAEYLQGLIAGEREALGMPKSSNESVESSIDRSSFGDD